MNDPDRTLSNSSPAEPAAARPRLKVFAWRVAGFLAIFVVLQAGWEAARGTWLERLWIHDLTVGAATVFINQLTPAVKAVAQGSRIVAPGGGLNVLFGCEGTDVVFMLVAAFAVFPMPGRWRLWGMACGLLWVFVLNQLRIAALFYAFRSDKELFDLMHNIAAPLVMIALTGGFFQLWIMRAERRGLAAPAPSAA
jgi:exosortase/archaeosortase family protein